MLNKGLFIFAACTLSFTMFLACERTGLDDLEDLEKNVEEDSTDYTWDSSTVVEILLEDDGIKVDPPVAGVSGNIVNITSAGTYSISGSLSDGQLIVNTEDEDDVRLILDGVNINNSSSAPVFIEKAEKAIFILNDGTDNYLTDASEYSSSDEEPNATLFSNSYLSFSGGGSLLVTGNHNDGISSDDGLVIDNGNITVVAEDDGIRGKDYLIVRDGNITVNSKGDGLKSTNSDDSDLGYIIIESGEIDVTSTSGDGISAETDLYIAGGIFNITSGGGASSLPESIPHGGGPGGGASGYSGTISVKALKCSDDMVIENGSFTINSADDAINSNGNILISDGTFNVTTGDDFVHADVSITIDGGNINVTGCYEGLESASITVNKGDLYMASDDDGFNATKGQATESNDGSCLYVNGGNIEINASGGDAIDSNGNVVMTGGTLVAHGPSSSPEVGIDVNGSFNISGGVLVASGPNSGHMIEGVSSSSSQYSILATMSSGLSSGSLFNISDESGASIITYKPIRKMYYIVISTPELQKGGSYSIYTGGSSTGTYTNGLYIGGDYSGGTLKRTLTLSNRITSVSI